ncbi:hypothetical protein BDF20DRAFT_867464 [Mycotypha africana]|uniref:uncharacterized protein n=1 Tax=Mycotypha africana TaxID=64632 RepID=UPI002301AD33|nr:uncharacterized protein BDF20DRAFT_867464 [Mycotypha africana]KAI8979068.1 hypothetical protein BDF20DRAFT_867464 [Mycotypha africana]
MSQLPSELREGHLKEATKVFKTIAPTTLTTTRAQNTPVITAATAATTTNTQPLQKNVPAFLNKLYSMVNDPESDDLICWADDGLSFFVNRQEDFARKVLPRFFKHNKFSSFVRQLNMYGFHKVPHLQQGVLETDNESERWEFSNPHFQRNQPDLLLLVTRKKGPTSSSGNGGHDGEKEISSLDLQHILEEIQSIKKHQLNISTQLQNIQRDNQVLWNETIQARERHLRHQETIDKILRFLASVFSNGEKRHAIPRKRRYLLESGHASGQNGNIEEELMSQPQDEILSTTGSIDNNISNTSSDSNRPTKVPRRQQPSATSSSASTTFNIDDFVNGRSDPSQLSTALPSHVNQNALSSTGSSDLADAIALNNQAKNGRC